MITESKNFNIFFINRKVEGEETVRSSDELAQGGQDGSGVSLEDLIDQSSAVFR